MFLHFLAALFFAAAPTEMCHGTRIRLDVPTWRKGQPS
jgi:hypothetical protein